MAFWRTALRLSGVLITCRLSPWLVARGAELDFAVGDRVEGLFEEDGYWYPATVASGADAQGRFLINWDDSDERERLKSSEQLREFSNSPPESLAVGDRVKALFQEDERWYPAVVVQELEPGRFLIDWEDTDEREREKGGHELRKVSTPLQKLQWFADNRQLRASGLAGVDFCRSRDEADTIPGRTLHWGRSVEGVAVQGWLRVDDESFLPMRLNGIPVLRPASAPETPPPSGKQSPPAFARLASWLEDECGATGVNRTFVSLFDKGGVLVRGVGVAGDVPRGEEVVCMPHRCALNPNNPQDYLLPPDAANGSCDGNSHLAYWMALEQEKGEASSWARYFAVLPSEADYRQFHPAYLEDFQLRPEVDCWSTWLETLRRCHAGRAAPSFEALKLQYVRTITRQFEGSGLVPWADMPNTGTEAENNVVQVLNDDGDFCLSASRDLWAGEELLLDYGEHGPMMMLLIYGFSLPAEYHSTASISGNDCSGLGGLGSRLGTSASPALRNFARFTDSFCGDSGEAAGATDEAGRTEL